MLQSALSDQQDRAIRLFTYLKEITELRTKPVRDFANYEDVIWLCNLPSHPSVSSVYSAEVPIAEITGEHWVEIQKPRPLADPPAPPDILAAWLDPADIENSSLDTLQLKTLIPRSTSTPEASAGSLSDEFDYLDEHPELPGILDAYIRTHWRPWATQDRVERAIKSAYEQLFSMYQTQQRAGEQFEVILGLGLLTWEPAEASAIRRHLVTAPASIVFDSTSGTLTVSPGPDGVVLNLEHDMLDPVHRPESKEEQTVRTYLLEAGDAVWERTDIGNALRSWVHAVDADGRFEDTLEPRLRVTQTPHVHLAPAIILRRRTDRSLLRMLGTIVDQIETTGVVPEGVRSLIETSDEALFDETLTVADSSRYLFDHKVYFPLEANEEQLEILERLEHSQGVLVQGPPGTGKSHTIANLIAHLLATGQRVLVTSHTPRALKVLRGKLPEEIRSLCVSLVGSDRTAIDEVETSVLGITQRYDRYDPRRQRARVAELEHQLEETRRSNARIRADLRALRERETHIHILEVGDYRGTAQKIAERLTKEASTLGWIEDTLPIDAAVPLTDSEAKRLLYIVRRLDAERIDSLAALDITANELPPPNEFAEFVDRERRARQHVSARADVDYEPGPAAVRSLDRTERDQIRQQIHDADNQLSVVRDLSPSVANGLFDALRQGSASTLKRLLIETRDTLERLRALDPSTLRATIVGLDSYDPKTVKRDALALSAHLRTGKGRGLPGFRPQVVKDTEYLTRAIFVDQQPCSSIGSLQALVDRIDAESLLETARVLWAPYQPLHTGSISRQVEELEELGKTLEVVLTLSDAYDRLNAMAGWMYRLGPLSWETSQELRRMESILDAADAIEASAQATKALLRAVQPIERSTSRHLAVDRLRAAVDARSVEAYASAYEVLAECDQDRALLETRALLVERLGSAAPLFLQALLTHPFDPAWDDRIQVFRQSWDHRRAHAWLDAFDQPGRMERLLEDLERGTTKERHIIEQLSAEMAWLHFFNRMRKDQAEYLKAWSLAVRKIGKGTGKHAARHRAVARENMAQCRSAIPAWIMPIYRIPETLDATVDAFDVVIVDEASQSGPEALFLQYLAKKIVIVGDDKQIAPSTFIEGGAVERLRARQIPDLPHSSTLGYDNSFFDQAVIRFAGRVRLREHFRCMPEIIQFSNNLSYQYEPLIPLRQYGFDRLDPVKTTFVPDGIREGTSTSAVNRAEAEAIAQCIVDCCRDPRYDSKSIGVITLLGNQQSRLIEHLLLERLDPEEIGRRNIQCGNAYDFQGDERDIIFLSMVISPSRDGSRPNPALTSEVYKRAFNVAASRARDQLWLFHSVTLNDLPNPECVRRKLLEYCLDPHVESSEYELPDDTRDEVVPPFESVFEQEVYRRIRQRGYRVLPQVEVGAYRIDLVVEGLHGRLAVECDGDQWHGPEQYDYDVARQRQLERAGWKFWRVSGSDFYRDPDRAMSPLWPLLDRLGIFASSNAARRSLAPSSESLAEESNSPVDSGYISRHSQVDGHTSSSSEPKTTSTNSDEAIDHMPVSTVSQPVISTPALNADELTAFPPSNGSIDTASNESNESLSPSDPSNDPYDIDLFAAPEIIEVVEEVAPIDRRASRSLEQVPEQPVSPPTGTRVPADTIAKSASESASLFEVSVRSREADHIRFGDVAKSFLLPYSSWPTRRLPDPRDRPIKDTIVDLIEIIDVEGPVLARRVYGIYAVAAGFSSEPVIRSALNSALHNAITQHRVEFANEWNKPGQIDRILRLPGRSRVRLRFAGDRSLPEVPPSEIAELVNIVAEECGVDPRQEGRKIFEAVLDAYEFPTPPTEMQSSQTWASIKFRIAS